MRINFIRCLSLLCAVLHSLAVCDIAASDEPQKITGDYASRVKIGMVRMTGSSEVLLTFPDGFMDDSIKGRISLHNDSDQSAAISEVETPCGCTVAVPVDPIVEPGQLSSILFDFHPSEAGKKNVGARFRFGRKEFYLAGLATTRHRFAIESATLVFNDQARATLKVKKLRPGKLTRAVAQPAYFKVKITDDTPDAITIDVTATQQATGRGITLTLHSEQKAYSPIHLETRFPGVVELLPRHIYADQDQVTFFLRGDTTGLADKTELQITVDGKTQRLPCAVTAVGKVVRVELQNNFPSGSYRADAQIGVTRFMLPITAR